MTDPTSSALKAAGWTGGAAELLPCPFCGKQPVKERTGFGLRAMYIYCNNADDACPCPKAVGQSEEAAIRNWNLRYPGAAPTVDRRYGCSVAQQAAAESRLATIEAEVRADQRERDAKIADCFVATVINFDADSYEGGTIERVSNVIATAIRNQGDA